MEVWRFIQDCLQQNIPIMLLWVVQSEGSSPGRRGFKMAVANNGDFEGTIGGGIMEHKLVEKARSMLTAHEQNVSLITQYHDKQHAKDQSGMICSGSQQVAFVPLNDSALPVVQRITQAIAKHEQLRIALTPNGISLIAHEDAEEGLIYEESNWKYIELADQRPVVHIIGAGHVGLALSELMHYLGFYIKLYDNRPKLNTFDNNAFAHEKHVVDYDTIGEVIPANEHEYVVIMTFGYRDDKIVFRQMADKQFFYLGMMGSDEKIRTLYDELANEGFTKDKWTNCHAPIGINIFSKTTREIAVSIAAEIIKEKNKYLPTGRHVYQNKNEA